MTEPTSPTLTAKAASQLQTFVNGTERNDAQILRRIESLDVSADVKALLADLLRLATRVGDTVLRIGRKVLDFILSMTRQFPAMGFVVVIVAVITLLVSMVPFIGGVLASVLGPLALALGVGWSATLEMQEADFRARVAEFAGGFQTSAA